MSLTSQNEGETGSIQPEMAEMEQRVRDLEQ
jgi:hypothetical protein